MGAGSVVYLVLGRVTSSVLLWGASVGGGAVGVLMLSLHYGAGGRFLPSQVVVFVWVTGRALKRLGKGCFASFWGMWCGRECRVSQGPFSPHYGAFLGWHASC